MKTQLLILFLMIAYQLGFGQGWGQTQKLVAADRSNSDELGYSIAIDGDYLIAGSTFNNAPNLAEGAVYVFKKDAAGNWSEHQKLLHPNSQGFDFLGADVAISGNFFNRRVKRTGL